MQDISKDSRTFKSVRNVSYGILFQVINAVMSFVSRSFIIKYLGLDAVSLHGLFWELITMISMAELGIGYAVTYNLYEPLSKNDTKKVAQLMQMYKIAYRVIAAVTFTVGSVLAIFIPYIVKGLHYDDTYTRVIFMLYVVKSSLSYLLTYKTTLLSADQKKYKYTWIHTISRVVEVCVLVTIMVVTKSYIVYMIGDILVACGTNFCCNCQANRIYPYLKEKVEKIDKKERKNVFVNIKDVFIKKLSGQITNSTDNILISTLVGTKLVGYYSNYSAIFSVFTKLEGQISAGILASLGNLIVTEDSERVEKVLNKITDYYFLFALISSAGVYTCAKPFICIWLGKEYVMAMPIVFICCFNLFLNLVKGPIWQAVDAAGLFKADKYISIIGNVVNLVVSLVAGHFYGMIGIFAGTALTLIINLFMKIALFCKVKLKKNYKKYIAKWMKMLLSFVCILPLIGFLCDKCAVSNNYLTFIINGCISVIVSVVMVLVVYPGMLNFREIYGKITKRAE